MASSAGLNRVGLKGGETLLKLTANSAGTALDSGLQMAEAAGMKTWQFQFDGLGSTTVGYTVTLYGTFSRSAYDIYHQLGNYTPTLVNPATTGRGSTLLPLTSFFVLPGPSEQSGTGLSLNPMVSGGAAFTSSVLVVSMALTFVRAIAVVTGTPSDVEVIGFAIP
jgi:hypothetical protein